MLEAAGIQRGSGSFSDLWAEHMAKIHLRPGTNPILVTTSEDMGENEAAIFKTETPNLIYVSEAVLVRFEKDYPHEGAFLFMKATILHEFVHFLDYHRDGSLLDAHLPKEAKKTAKDRGDIFEEKAFGRIVPDWEQVNPVMQ